MFHPTTLTAMLALALLPCSGCLSGYVDREAIAREAATEAAEPMRLAPLWSLEGSWMGVAAVPDRSAIYAASAWIGAEGWEGSLARIDAEGNILREVPIAGRDGMPSMLTLLDREGGAPIAVTAGFWQPEVNAFDCADGRRLWHYRGDDVVDTISRGDIDGDGNDEALIGLNAYGGLHILRQSGERAWRTGVVGSVRSIDVLEPGTAACRVVTTSADEHVHFFTGAGAEIAKVRPPWKRGGTRTMRVLQRTDQQPARIVAVTTQPLRVALLELDGTPVWTRDAASKRSYTVDAAVSPDQNYIALSLARLWVVVIDLRTGDRVASVRSRRAALAWINRPGSSPALVVSDSALTGYSLEPKTPRARGR